jgi:hypothetical protein
MLYESPAGQPFNGTLYTQIVTEDGEVKGYILKGIDFWCREIKAQQCSRQFRSNIEGKTVSVFLGSTNVSKLKGLDTETDAQIVYNGFRHKVVSAEFDHIKGIYTIALS